MPMQAEYKIIFIYNQREPRLTIRGAFPVYQYQQTLADIFGNRHYSQL